MCILSVLSIFKHSPYETRWHCQFRGTVQFLITLLLSILTVAFRIFVLRENFPKAKSFITCTCHYCLRVRRHRKIEHSVLMSRQRRQLLHRRILPNDDSVVLETVRRHQLVARLAEHEAAHLRASLHRLHLHSVLHVPEFDLAICCATSTCHDARLVRTPCDCLHGSFVRLKIMQWNVRSLLVRLPHL